MVIVQSKPQNTCFEVTEEPPPAPKTPRYDRPSKRVLCGVLHLVKPWGWMRAVVADSLAMIAVHWYQDSGFWVDRCALISGIRNLW
jgi:hypothetical protein